MDLAVGSVIMEPEPLALVGDFNDQPAPLGHYGILCTTVAVTERVVSLRHAPHGLLSHNEKHPRCRKSPTVSHEESFPSRVV